MKPTHPNPSETTPEKHAVIVGGGITGSAAAYYLDRKARASGRPLKITLLEKAPALGGKIVTEQAGDFLIDGGPDCFVTHKPWAVSLCRELSLDDQLMSTNEAEKKTFVLNNGQLTPLPEGVMLIVPTRFLPFATSPLFSIPGKIRMGMEILIPPRKEDGDETLADFMRRRLGQEALDKLAQPLLSGIYSSDPEHLSLKSSFPRFLELEQEYGSITRGMLAAKRRRAGRKSSGSSSTLSMFVTLKDGLEVLIHKLAERLEHQSIRTGKTVSRITRAPGNRGPYHIELDDQPALEADAVLLTTPAFVSGKLMKDMAPNLAEKLERIRFASTVVATLGFESDQELPDLEGFGFLVPKTEERRINACTWSSQKFDCRAPAGKHLIRCFLGGPGKEHLLDLNDQEVIETVREELAQIVGLQAPPDLTRIYRWIDTHPQYDLGHVDRVKDIRRQAQTHPGLALAGSSYDGIGIPDCVRQAEEAVNVIWEDLTQEK